MGPIFSTWSSIAVSTNPPSACSYRVRNELHYHHYSHPAPSHISYRFHTFFSSLVYSSSSSITDYNRNLIAILFELRHQCLRRLLIPSGDYKIRDQEKEEREGLKEAPWLRTDPEVGFLLFLLEKKALRVLNERSFSPRVFFLVAAKVGITISLET